MEVSKEIIREAWKTFEMRDLCNKMGWVPNEVKDAFDEE